MVIKRGLLRLSLVVVGGIFCSASFAGAPDNMAHQRTASSPLARHNHFYVDAAGGVAFVDGLVHPSKQLHWRAGAYTGYNVGGAVGYQFSNNISLEAAIRYINNGPSSVPHAGGFHYVMYTADAKYSFDLGRDYSPFIGGGIGFADPSVVSHDGLPPPISGSFAYQAMAGVRFAVNSTWGVTFGYHFVGETSNWYTRGAIPIDIKAPFSHLFNIGFSYNL